MKKCQRCNFENEDNALFCCNCGEKLEIEAKRNYNVLAWLGLITLVMGFIGIFSNLHKDATYINVSNDYVEFRKNGGKKEIIIDSDGSWDVKHPGRCKITKKSNKILISCDRNIMDRKDREDSIIVFSGNLHEIIEISQSGYEHIYFETEIPKRISYKGDTILVKINTSCESYTVWHPKNWTKIDFTEDGFMLIIDENSEEEREGEITAVGKVDYEVDCYANFIQSGNPNY